MHGQSARTPEVAAFEGIAAAGKTCYIPCGRWKSIQAVDFNAFADNGPIAKSAQEAGVKERNGIGERGVARLVKAVYSKKDAEANKLECNLVRSSGTLALEQSRRKVWLTESIGYRRREVIKSPNLIPHTNSQIDTPNNKQQKLTTPSISPLFYYYHETSHTSHSSAILCEYYQATTIKSADTSYYYSSVALYMCTREI